MNLREQFNNSKRHIIMLPIAFILCIIFNINIVWMMCLAIALGVEIYQLFLLKKELMLKDLIFDILITLISGLIGIFLYYYLLNNTIIY